MNYTLLMLTISIISGVIIGLIALAITREGYMAKTIGTFGAIVGALVGYFIAKSMLLNSAVTVPDQVTVQTVSQESITVEELKEMTVEEIQELIREDPVVEDQKESVTIDELRGMTVEEIQELINTDKE